MHTSNHDVQALKRPAPQNEDRKIVAQSEIELMLTADQARDLFYLDGGLLRNRIQRGRRAKPGGIAGSLHGSGYLAVKINNTRYRVHRVIWLVAYGRWPIGQIDHINGVRDDNRLENLREVSAQGNQQNQHLRADNTSGVAGVYQYRGSWVAKIRDGGKRISLGSFKTVEEAAAARKAAEQKLGFHPNFGKTDSARRNGLPSLNAPRILRTA